MKARNIEDIHVCDRITTYIWWLLNVIDNTYVLPRGMLQLLVHLNIKSSLQTFYLDSTFYTDRYILTPTVSSHCDFEVSMNYILSLVLAA